MFFSLIDPEDDSIVQGCNTRKKVGRGLWAVMSSGCMCSCNERWVLSG